MPSRRELQQALMHAAIALRDAQNAETLCQLIGDDVWIAIGTADNIRARLPPPAASDFQAAPQVPI
jgi:hypothetical protein